MRPTTLSGPSEVIVVEQHGSGFATARCGSLDGLIGLSVRGKATNAGLGEALRLGLRNPDIASAVSAGGTHAVEPAAMNADKLSGVGCVASSASVAASRRASPSERN
jgi:hypothetical protein